MDPEKPTLPTDSKKPDPAAAGDPPAKPPVKPDPPAQTAPPDQQPPSKDDLRPAQGLPQSKVDALVGQARLEGKSAERAALLKELGVTDLEAAQKLLKDADELRKSQMTETERLKTDKEAAEKAAADARAVAERATAEAQAALLRAAVVSRASGRFANPEAAFKLVDLSKVQAKDGQFEGIDEALNALAEKEPWTLTPKGPAATKLGATNSGGKPATRTDEDRRAEYFGGGRKKVFFEEGGVVLPKEG